MSGDIDELGELVAEQLLATVSEGLSNVARHADATTAEIDISCVGDEIRLEITDNGVGVRANPKRNGGLSNMMWRAAELGGTCSIGAAHPAGTRLVWNVPL